MPIIMRHKLSKTNQYVSATLRYGRTIRTCRRCRYKYCYAVAITRSSGSDPEWYVEPAIRRGWLPSCPYREEKHIVRVIEGEPPSERLLSEHRARPLEVMWPPNIRESEEEWETQVKDADVICID